MILIMDAHNSQILIDSDVISHFITNNCLKDLPEILAPYKCIVLDIVYNEITRNQIRKAFLDSTISAGEIILSVFPHNDLDIKMEYAQIKKNNYLIGDGERACMAVAKFNKNIIASSNFRDITTYCKLNNINYIGTLDILSIAFTKNIFTEEQCDKFIKEALTLNKARFPTGITRIRDYIPHDLSFME